MRLINYSCNCEKLFASSVVALGFFDGVHIGHRALFKRAEEEAKKRKIPFVIFTFYSENEAIKGKGRLYTSEEKTELLKSSGADALVLADFAEIADVSAEDFVLEILVKKLGAKLAVSGTDFRFGKDRRGDADMLRRLMTAAGGEFTPVSDVELFGKKVSTTLIKELLSEGKAHLAEKLLGSPYFISGKVMHGDGRGASLGSPTVNLSLPESKSFLKFGVYMSRIKIDGKFYTGLTNIGVCPTFGERAPHAETFILDFSGVLYGEKIKIELLSFLREEKQFSSKEELLMQIEKDIEKVGKSDGRKME